MVKYFTLVVILLVAFQSGVVFAQNFENNLEQRIDSVFGPTIEDLIGDETGTGASEDLFLLIRPKLFKAYLNPSVQYTDNVFLNGTKDDDTLANLRGGIEFRTLIDEKFDFFANAETSATRYLENETLDYSVLKAGIGVTYNYKNFLLTTSYEPNVIHEDIFQEVLISSHSANVSLTRPFGLKSSLILAPFVNGRKTYTNPAEFSFTEAQAGALMIYQAFQNTNFRFGFYGTHRHYDDYFEATTAQERKDNAVTATAGFDWKLKDGISFKGDVAFTHNNSTLNMNDYNAFTATPSLKLSVRF